MYLSQRFLRAPKQFATTLTALGLCTGLTAGLTAGVTAGLAMGPLAAPAAALHNPAAEENLPVWQNTNGRSTDPQQQVEVAITDVEPRTLSAPEPQATYRLTITNQRDQPVHNVSVRLQSLPAASTAAEVRRAALSNSGEYTESTAAVDLPPLQAHETREIKVTLALEPEQTSTSGVFFPASHLQQPGPHPIMFTLSGDTLQGQTGIVGVARTTLTVNPNPNQPTPNQPNPNQPEQHRTAPLTFLWPLSTDTDVAPGGTGDAPERAPLLLRSEKLAKELSDGGRLRGLLDAYRQATADDQQLRTASCIAIDPELVDTVQRMAHGYRVGEQNTLEDSQPRRLRDSWGEIFGTADDGSVEGTGSAAAQRWLDDLRSTVAGGCTVALPYAGADVNTLAETGNQELLDQALEPNRNIIREVLGVDPLENVTVPTSGYITEQAASAYADRTALVADNSISITEQAQLADNPAETPEDAAAAQTRADRTVHLPEQNVTALRYSGDLATALRATGSHPQVAGFSNPESRFDVSQDSDVARMGDALGVLDREVAAGDPVLAVPPVDWSVSESDATALLSTFSSLFHSHRAQPASLHDSLVPRGIDSPAVGRTSQPFDDPGEPTTEFAQDLGEAATQVQKLRGLMLPDDRLALTPEVYTRPLLQDLLRAAAGQRANSRQDWASVRAGMSFRVDTVRRTVQALRGTISLVPPGNVFTRSSDSSPLLVVARNGLPLPVPINVSYATTPENFRLEVPERQIIPAEGSITLSLNTVEDTPAQPQADRVDVKLWLNSTHGDQINDAVELAVQRAPGMGAKGMLVVLVILAVLAFIAKTLWNRRVAGKRSSVRRRP